ncbi:hypothetical protein GmHk_18G051760 [Glycine max]|nr:hypothetical protein GmHk_18G051760 [Glycine max]
MAKQRKLKQVYGNWEESYKQLPRCPLAMNDSLPRTIIDFHTRPTIERGRLVPGKTTFQRGFWAFKPCIRGNNHIFPITFAIVEGETTEDWFFFFKNLGTHVTPQSRLCLILDRHKAIKSDYNREDSGWGGQEFGKLFNKSLTNVMEKYVTYHVESYDRQNKTFTLTETINPHKVYLETQKCDCRKFQAFHMPFHHIIIACAHFCIDQWSYVSPVYRLQNVFNVYNQ